MKVLHVASGIAPESGGPTRSVKGLCRALSKAGIEVTLFVLHGDHEFDNPCGVKIIRGRLNHIILNQTIKQFDLVHIHGLWNRSLHRVATECRKVKMPYVISPRGMLDPWALSVKKWKKRVAMFLYQKRDLKSAAAFHVTAALEEQSVRAQGLKQPVIIAPNGVNIPDERVFECSECSNGLVGKCRTAIFLSRLHPGKGLLLLTEAWARVKPHGWVMKVVGPDSYGHKAEVLAKLNELGIRDQWQFVDMVDDVRKWQEYAAADLLIHPSVSENFGITIAEGLVAGLPVICTDGTPWVEIVERKCGWYIKANSVGALAIALREATNSTELPEMGARGRKLVEDRYLWSAVCGKMVRGYEEVLNGRA